MADFLLDFRDPASRGPSIPRAASLFAFTEDIRIQTLNRPSFSLVLASVDDAGLWGPYEHQSSAGNLLVALAGRVALEEEEWDEARKQEGQGGLACKAIAAKYRKGGLEALGSLNGNFAVFVHDGLKRRFFLVTDRCGMLLAYGTGDASQSLVFGSHADVLAAVTGESQKLDMASLAEFLMTSRLSFPYTYYKHIRALEPASILTLDLSGEAARYESQTRYFRPVFKIDPDGDANDLAERLSIAFKNAVRRRTLPIFGCTGIALSGGLDSRAILSAVDPRTRTRAFNLFDEENAEYRTAKIISEACGVEMVPIQRDFDYYARSAELGVRVSGGTGCITCNHFLGARERLREAGIENLLTGCYCDYLFKGLAFNRREQMLSRSEGLNGFQFEFYDSFHWLETPWRDEVVSRLRLQFPEAAKPELSSGEWLEVERKRTFPLAYEQDLAQRVIPQRLMPWFVPAVDNELIEVYLSLPPRLKLNGTVFRKMLPLICRKEVCDIADNNTGSRLDAAWPAYAVARCASALRNRVAERIQERMATSGSWPNWRYYLRQSERFSALWNRPNPQARELFSSILGKDPYERSIGDYAAKDLSLFQRLVTQKLWLDQRVL
jgi:asparagine synthase (glutamine-hydrolysing)